MDLESADPEVVVQVSENIQRLFLDATVPKELEQSIYTAYDEMAANEEPGGDGLKVAMRSSAIGEDSELSFAGQYLTILNVAAGEDHS